MGIDPLTFIAQIVNLFVLVWILKRFLYQPVLNILTQRQKQIEEMTQTTLLLKQEAEDKSHQLQCQQKKFEKKMQTEYENFQHQCLQDKLVQEKKVKTEVQNLRQRLYDDLNAEKFQIQAEAERFISQDFLKLTTKIMSDLTQTTPFAQVIDLFIQKTDELKKSDIIKLNNILKKQYVITINSSKTLTQKQKNIISYFIKNRLFLTPKHKIQFVEQKDLILGVELRVGTFAISWTVQSYLQELESNLNQSLLKV